MLSSNVLDEMPDAAYEDFKVEFEKLAGIRLSLYKEKQMKRRINTLIARKGFSDYGGFLELLRTNALELASFIDYITINVTEFFRTPDHWGVVEESVLPELLSRNDGKLKIWSCACATGEEAYSLAMSLLKLAGDADFEVLATDIDDTVLNKAISGIYDTRSLETVPEEMKAYFIPYGTQWKVSDRVRAHVVFRKLDLLRDTYPSDCDLIVCRNVLIYFTEEGKTGIYEQFLNSLRSGGYLFTGNTEQIVYFKAYGFKKVKSFIYRKG